ncbi:hypothetical protein KEM52_000964, partial [Ascosphaera acerosa]
TQRKHCRRLLRWAGVSDRERGRRRAQRVRLQAPQGLDRGPAGLLPRPHRRRRRRLRHRHLHPLQPGRLPALLQAVPGLPAQAAPALPAGLQLPRDHQAPRLHRHEHPRRGRHLRPRKQHKRHGLAHAARPRRQAASRHRRRRTGRGAEPGRVGAAASRSGLPATAM